MAPTPNEHELDNPKIRALLNDIATRIDSALPPGWGFALYLFEFAGVGDQMFWISNAQREPMLHALYEFIARQHIILTHPSLSTSQDMVAVEIRKAIAWLQESPALRYESDVLIDCAHRMEERGGSFVKQLAHLYFMADGRNQQRLLASWANYFIDYAS